MHPSTLLLAVFATPLLALAAASEGSAASSSLDTSSPRLKRRAPQLRSQRSNRKRSMTRSSSPFVESSSKVALTRLATRSDKNAHLHPQVLLQQHIHRGVKRHARMTKRSLGENSEIEMKHEMVKRWESVTTTSSSTSDDTPPDEKTKKKRWLGGVALAGATETVQQIQDRLSRILSKDRQLNQNITTLPGHGAIGMARYGVSGYAGANIAKSRSAQANDTDSTASTNRTRYDNTRDGYSIIDLEAASSNRVTPATAPTAINSLGLAIEANDVGYFATVQVGEENTEFRVLMDSGSADFWIPSTACTACGGHTAIGPEVSGTFQDTTTEFTVTYGTGDVAGTTVIDDATIAGLKLTALKFGAVTQESNDFSDPSVPFDGLMGLAQSILANQQGVPTPIEQLAAEGQVTSAQMGYHLARLSDGENDGEITFGGVDATKYNGSLTEFPNVNNQGFWEGAMDDVAVDGKSLGLSGRTAILDTGTTLLIAPAPDAEAIHAAIPGAKSDGQGGFTLPCTTNATLSLTFAGRAFNIRPDDLTFLPVSDDLKGECVSGISSGTIGGANEWLVGAVFLKNVYFATDVGSNMMGLAPSITAI
ncbi:pepsin-like aspartic protease [Sporobolomyces salmoneus]|uniref:pepsin-like aspartic protease n=1 Tax=Sporobolomyces salmoneus TaxID=183962 RepID=UPI00317DEFBC